MGCRRRRTDWAGRSDRGHYGPCASKPGACIGRVGKPHRKDANSVSRNANDFAAEANTISREANDYAQEANSISKSEAVKAGELHRIDWDFRWVGPGKYRVGNRGPDDAKDVHIQVTVAHETITAELPHLEASEAVVLDFPKVRERLEGFPKVHDREYRLGTPEVHIRHLLTRFSPKGNPQKHDQLNPVGRLQ